MDEDVVMEDVVDVEDEGELSRIAGAVTEIRSHTGQSAHGAVHHINGHGRATGNGTTDTIAVVDTNFVIAQGDLLQEFIARTTGLAVTVLIPWMVLVELDRLKTSDKADVAARSRRATHWILHALESHSIRGQRRDEIIETDRKGDDSILDCCRFFREVERAQCALLSGDTNLCAKARVHDVPSVKIEVGMRVDRLVGLLCDGTPSRSLDLSKSVLSPRPAPVPSPRAVDQYAASQEMQTDAIIAPYHHRDSFKQLDEHLEKVNRPRRTTDQVLDSLHRKIVRHFPKLIHAQVVRDTGGDREAADYLYGTPQIGSVDDVVEQLILHRCLVEVCDGVQIGGQRVKSTNWDATLKTLKDRTRARSESRQVLDDWTALWIALSQDADQRYKTLRDREIADLRYDLNRTPQS